MKLSRKIGWFFLVAFGAMLMVGCSTERTREDKVSAIIDEVDSPFLIVNAVPGDLIEKSGALDGALPFTQEMLLSFFIDESVTGVDYDVDVQIIIGKGPSFAPNFYGIFKLKDENAFIELLETEANADVLEKDGFKYVIKESDQYVIVWNEEFAIASNIPIDFAAMMSGNSSKGGMKAVDKGISMIKAASEGEVNEGYKSFLENESDIAIHFSGKGFYAYMLEMSMGESEELEANKETLEGINTNMYLNFNMGSIDLQFVSDLSEKVKENIGFFKEGAVNQNLLALGNSADPMVSMAYHLDFGKALDYSKEQMSEFAYQDLEENLTDMGLSIDDARNALTGEMVFIVDRLEIIEREIDWGYGEPYLLKEPMPIFALIVGVSDKTILMNALADSSDVIVGEGIVKKGDAYIVMKGDILFSTNDSLWATKVNSGGTVKINDKQNVFANQPFGLFIDFVTIAKMDDVDDVKPLIEQMVDAHGSGNLEEMNFSFVFKDASKNALRILTETISNMTNRTGEGEEYEQLEAELEAAAVPDEE